MVANDQVESMLDQELVGSIKRLALSTPFTIAGSLAIFGAVDALETGIAISAIAVFAGLLHALTIYTPWFLSSRLFTPSYLIFAAALGAVPLLAMPGSQNGQTMLLIVGAVCMPELASVISPHRGFGMLFVAVLGFATTASWIVADSQLNGAMPELLLAVLAVVVLSRVDHRASRHEQLAERTLAATQVAEVDGLTGLYRRAAFLSRIDAVLAEHGRGTLFFIDLDRFKLINDTLGHGAGDQLLVEVASRVRDALDPTAFAGRVGGDEFAVFAPRTGRHSACALGDRLSLLFDDDFQLVGRTVAMTASIGVATASDETADSSDLMRFADTAMYSAKQDSSTVRVFDEPMRAELMHVEDTELALRAALQDKDIVAHLQPIIDIGRNHIAGLEALARWHRSGEIVAAADFMGGAVRSKLLPAITRCVAEDLIGFVRSFGPGDLPTVGVNIEAGDLIAFLEWTEQHDLDPNQWIIEITESQILHDDAQTAHNLARASAMGFGLVLDDFGTGHSSLARLLHLPINGIKIDGSFVQQVNQNHTAHSIVSAMTSLAQDCGLLVIAECVETAQQVNVLRDLGVRHMQGHYFHHPTATANIIDLSNACETTIILSDLGETDHRSRLSNRWEWTPTPR